MKFLIISQYSGAPNLGMVSRNYHWALELIRLGHNCTIVAASYSHYRRKNPKLVEFNSEKQVIEGIDYCWIKTPVYNGDSSIGRLISIFKFQLGLSYFLRKSKRDYEVIIVSSPHPFQIFQAYFFSKKCNAKLIFDIRDLWPLTLIKIGHFAKNHLVIKALFFAESFALKRANLITAVPQNCKRYLKSRGMLSSKFLHIGNGYNYKTSSTNIPLNKFLEEKLSKIKNKGAKLIGYCGTLGLANAMHIPIEALAKTENINIHLIVLGKGQKKEELKSRAKELNIEKRVHFFEPIPFKQVQSFLAKVDVAYAGGLNSFLYKYGCSLTKINDYMAASKPIIYAIGDPSNPVEISGCGISCQPENSFQIAKAMDMLCDMPKAKLNKMGKKGTDWLNNNQTIEIQIKKILSKLYYS